MSIGMTFWIIGYLTHDRRYMDVPLCGNPERHIFLVISNMVLPGKQPGLLVAVIVPAFLSTLVVIARSMRKVKRRPSHISKAGAFTAETLLIASVVSTTLMTCMASHDGLTSAPGLRLDLWRLRDHIDPLWLWYTPSRHLSKAEWHAKSHQCSLLADHRILQVFISRWVRTSANSNRLQRWVLHSLRSRASPTLQNMVVPQRQDTPNPQLGDEPQWYLASHLRYCVRHWRLRKMHSCPGELGPNCRREMLGRKRL